MTGLQQQITKLTAVIQGMKDEKRQDRLDRQQQNRPQQQQLRQPPPLMDEYDHYQNYPPYGGPVELGVPGSRAYNARHNIPDDAYVPPHRRPAQRSAARSAPRENTYTEDGLPICNHCQKPGHIASQCRTRQAQRQSKARNFRAQQASGDY